MALTLSIMSASQMDDLLRDEFRERVETQVPFLDSDDTDWRMRDQTQRGQYVVAQDDGKVVGIRKFYLWGNTKRDINQFLEGQGLPLVVGRVYQGAYVAVHPKYQRKGVGTALNNAVRDLLRPGDVLVLGSHEPDGKALNRAWLASVKGQVNILYGNRLTVYADYDPTRVNYVVSDGDAFGRVAVGPLSPRPGMNPDDKVLRSRLIRLASAKPELRPTILPLLKTAKVKGFDGLQKDSDKFSVDLGEFHSQLETDIEAAPQAFKVLYRPLLAKLESVQKVLKELSAAAKKVQDGLDKSRAAK